MAGLATTLGLAERGRRVVVLEAHRVGWGASGRNGGFVSAGFALGPSDLLAKVGKPRARELYRLSQDAVALVRRRAERIGDGVRPIVDGIANCSWFDDRGALERRAAFMNDTFGERREVWDRDRVRSIWRSPRYHGEVFNPEAFPFHSPTFSRGTPAIVRPTGWGVSWDTPVRTPHLPATPQ